MTVSSQEDFTLTEDAARLIARLADGGMRDALSLLDQCVAFSDHVDTEVVASTAGIAGSEQIFALAEAILSRETGTALRLVSELYENAKGIDRLCSEMIAHFRDVLLCRSVSDPAELVVCLPDELERLKQQAASVSLDRLMDVLSGFQRCLDNLGRSVNKKVEMEMTVIRLCSAETTSVPQKTAQPAVDTAALTARIAELERMVSAGLQTARAPSPRPAEVSRPAAAPDAEVLSGKIEPLPQWAGLLQELAVKEPALYVLLQDSTAARSGNVVLIQSPNAMLKKLLLADNIGARLADIVEEKLGSRHRLRVVKKEQQEASGTSAALDDILQKAATRNVEIHVRE